MEIEEINQNRYSLIKEDVRIGTLILRMYKDFSYWGLYPIRSYSNYYTIADLEEIIKIIRSLRTKRGQTKLNAHIVKT